MKQIFIFLTVLCFNLHLFGQDVDQILASITEIYTNPSNLEFEASVYYYPDVITDLATDSTLIKFRQASTAYNMEIEGSEIVKTDDINLYIDHRNKRMYVITDQSNTQMLGINQLQEFAKKLGLIEKNIKQISDDLSQIDFTDYTKKSIVSIVYNNCDLLLQKAIISIDPSIQLETELKNKKIETYYSYSDSENKKFSVSSIEYVELKKGEYIPSDKLSGYKVILN